MRIHQLLPFILIVVASTGTASAGSYNCNDIQRTTNETYRLVKYTGRREVSDAFEPPPPADEATCTSKLNKIFKNVISKEINFQNYDAVGGSGRSAIFILEQASKIICNFSSKLDGRTNGLLDGLTRGYTGPLGQDYIPPK